MSDGEALTEKHKLELRFGGTAEWLFARLTAPESGAPKHIDLVEMLTSSHALIVEFNCTILLKV